MGIPSWLARGRHTFHTRLRREEAEALLRALPDVLPPPFGIERTGKDIGFGDETQAGPRNGWMPTEIEGGRWALRPWGTRKTALLRGQLEGPPDESVVTLEPPSAAPEILVAIGGGLILLVGLLRGQLELLLALLTTPLGVLLLRAHAGWQVRRLLPALRAHLPDDPPGPNAGPFR